jgi:putative toxin-antitoxin system antitoxin component (TIGR02293 family)
MSHAGASAPLPAQPFLPDWKDVEKGLPLSSLEKFSKHSGIAVKDLLEVVIPPRTLKHRRAKGEPLSMDESDRLAGVARIYHLAARVYGDAAEGRDWLLRPKRRFAGRTALSMLKTRTGEEAVQEALIQLAEGMFI